MKPITEILTDYIDEDQNLQYVDVYHSEDENASGVTAGVLCLDTGKTIYFKNDYRAYKEVREAFAEIKAEWEADKKPNMVIEACSIQDCCNCIGRPEVFSDELVAFVQERYEEEANNDPTGDWQLWTENLIYNYMSENDLT